MMFFTQPGLPSWANERLFKTLDPTALATGVIISRKTHSSLRRQAKEEQEIPSPSLTPPLLLHSFYDLPIGETFTVVPSPEDVQAPGCTSAISLTRKTYKTIEICIPSPFLPLQSPSTSSPRQFNDCQQLEQVTATMEIQSYEGETLISAANSVCKIHESSPTQQPPPTPQLQPQTSKQTSMTPPPIPSTSSPHDSPIATEDSTNISPNQQSQTQIISGIIYVTNYRVSFTPQQLSQQTQRHLWKRKMMTSDNHLSTATTQEYPILRRRASDGIEINPINEGTTSFSATLKSSSPPLEHPKTTKAKQTTQSNQNQQNQEAPPSQPAPSILPSMVMSVAGSVLFGVTQPKPISATLSPPPAIASNSPLNPSGIPGAWSKTPIPLWFPLCVISKVIKSNGQPIRTMDYLWGGNQEKADDICLDITLSPYFLSSFFDSIRFTFEAPSACLQIHSAINKLFRPLKITDSFAFVYKPSTEDYGSHRCPSCTESLDEEAEFWRQGLDLSSQSCPWRETVVNKDYELSSSYPRVLVVPRSVKDETLIKVAEFRDKRRIPVLSWYNKHTGASITRGSQPMIGMGFGFWANRSFDDELLMESIRLANNSSKSLYILDSRPQSNGMINKVRGGGYENTAFYNHCTIEFLNMPNIHVVRNSFLKLRDLCGAMRFRGQFSSYSWLTSIAYSGWHDNLRYILYGVERIMSLVEGEHASVFVHCSDSWDRTAQLCSLSEICLDPYYRTMHGFTTLIEKEWIRMGHKDRLRADSLGNSGPGISEASPVFLQFMECVWQFTKSYPRSFEFSEDFLLTILDEMMLGKFGTFLCNSDKERSDNLILSKTSLLWPFILSHKDKYLNPFYQKPSEDEEHSILEIPQEFNSQFHEIAPPNVLVPRVEPHLILFWFNLWRRFFEGLTAITPPSAIGTEGLLIQEMFREKLDLEDQVLLLKSELERLKTNETSFTTRQLSIDPSLISASVSSNKVQTTKAETEVTCCGSASLSQNEEHNSSGIPNDLVNSAEISGHIMVGGCQAFTITDYNPLTLSRDLNISCTAERESTGDEIASQEFARLSRTNSVSSASGGSGRTTPTTSVNK